MKKIMIMVAVATAAVFTQAASVDWSIALTGGGTGRVWDATGSTVWTAATSGNKNQTAYFMLSSQVDAFVAALNAGESLDGKFLDSTTSFTAASGAGAASTANNALITTASQSFQLVLVYDDAKGDTYYKVSTVMASDARAQDTDPAEVSFATAANINGGGEWTQAVPEPTSGLLLLLGVASLALRRKQK